jgi:hypothetical protein
LQEEIISRDAHIDRLNADVGSGNEAVAELKATVADLGRRINEDEVRLREKDV